MSKLLIIALTVCSVLVVSCDRDKNNPGYDYFPDMFYSKTYETYAPNPNFTDGKTLQLPVPGTISRDGEYYPYKKVDEDIPKAAKLRNPFLPDTQNIARGKAVYQTICLQCHGVDGDGKGQLYLSGKYPYPPADLVHGRLKTKTDGEIFHSITVGFGVMGPHGLIVSQDDRWKIAIYLRSIQKEIK
jgi:mono/diheme cytochrome c family protein